MRGVLRHDSLEKPLHTCRFAFMRKDRGLGITHTENVSVVVVCHIAMRGIG